MKIWVDADACPNEIKDILYRAAERKQLPLTLVANHSLTLPPSKVISAVRVSGGFDVADNYIVKHLQQDDLVVTADIPLAAEVIAKNAHAINPRGELYTKENIRERLASGILWKRCAVPDKHREDRRRWKYCVDACWI